MYAGYRKKAGSRSEPASKARSLDLDTVGTAVAGAIGMIVNQHVDVTAEGLAAPGVSCAAAIEILFAEIAGANTDRAVAAGGLGGLGRQGQAAPEHSAGQGQGETVSCQSLQIHVKLLSSENMGSAGASL